MESRKVRSGAVEMAGEGAHVKGMPLASTFVLSSASSMSYAVATWQRRNHRGQRTDHATDEGIGREGRTSREASAMMGKDTGTLEISSMSLVQAACDEMSLADRPMTGDLEGVAARSDWGDRPQTGGRAEEGGEGKESEEGEGGRGRSRGREGRNGARTLDGALLKLGQELGDLSELGRADLQFKRKKGSSAVGMPGAGWR